MTTAVLEEPKKSLFPRSLSPTAYLEEPTTSVLPRSLSQVSKGKAVVVESNANRPLEQPPPPILEAPSVVQPPVQGLSKKQLKKLAAAGILTAAAAEAPK